MGGRSGEDPEGTHSSGSAGAGAIGLDDRALVQKAGTDSSGLLAVHGGVDAIAGEGNSASQLRRVGLGVGESPLGDDVDFTRVGQIVELGSIELDLDRLAGTDDLESVLGQAGGGHQQTNTIKVNLVAF